MIRVLLGSAAAAVAMLILGFILFATPLARIGIANLDDARAAAVQASLAVNLQRTGTYSVPGTDTPAQTNMYSRGPIATIHYNTGGFAADETTMLVQGLVFNFIIAVLIGLALLGIDGRVGDFASRARTVAIVAVAATAFTHLGEPIYMHHDWAHFIYLFVANALMLVAGGVIVAWFLPVRAMAVAAAPVEEPPPET
jgi:hypothetical protein